ncbi:uncharacterized protein LOC121370290 [Gigantopelta aegis]|uniref:uncharacterized protein LOC121370290 n=1 Tax=Gigantopelta aegis TaxID=1735272 RepID=UPI001B88AE10|nr:uncharacterized protein LOC121370290 [Gigantopelta aegis]
MSDYIRRSEQEEIFVSKVLDPRCKIIGVTGGPSTGKSTLMENVIIKVQHDHRHIHFVTVDLSDVTSQEEFRMRVLGELGKVDGKKVDFGQSNVFMEQVVLVVTTRNCKNICMCFDNIPRPSKDDKQYSVKNDAQMFMKEIVQNKELCSLMKVLYTSALQLRFCKFPRGVTFEATLRPLSNEESREVFATFGPENAQIDDAIVQCLRDVANGNPLVLQLLALELGSDEDLFTDMDLKELMSDDQKRLQFVSRENYTDDENIGKQLGQFVKSLSGCLQQHGQCVVKHGGVIDVDMLARAENKPAAVIKFLISQLLRANVIHRVGENRYAMSTLLMDIFKLAFTRKPNTRTPGETSTNKGNSDRETPVCDDEDLANRMSSVSFNSAEKKNTKKAEENQDISINDLVNSPRPSYYRTQISLSADGGGDHSTQLHMEPEATTEKSDTKHPQINGLQRSGLSYPDMSSDVRTGIGDVSDTGNNNSNDLSKNDADESIVNNLDYTIGTRTHNKPLLRNNSIPDDSLSQRRLNVRKSNSDTDLSSSTASDAQNTASYVPRSRELNAEIPNHNNVDSMQCNLKSSSKEIPRPCVVNTVSDSRGNVYYVVPVEPFDVPESPISVPQLRNLNRAPLGSCSEFVVNSLDSSSDDTSRKTVW